MTETGDIAEAPVTLQCLTCGYVIGSAELAACPECGESVTYECRDLHERRSEVAARALRGMRGSVVSVAMGLAGHMVAAGLIAQHPRAALVMGIGSAVLAAMVVFAGIAIVPWSGSADRSQDPGVERELVFRIWMQHAVWLAAPWLVVPPAGMVLFGMLFLTKSFWGAEFWQFGTALVLAMAWLGLVVNALSVWRERWDDTLRAASLHRTETSTRGVIAAGLLFLVGIPAGLVGLIVYSLWAFRAM